MIPTTTQIAERLDDLITHAGVWSRLLLERARRIEGAEESAPGTRQAAVALSEGAEAFRERADDPDGSPFGLLRAADRVLDQGPALRRALLAERDSATAPEDASWLTHEIRALDRVTAARRDLITLPPPGETPLAELDALRAFSGLLGQEIQIDFEARSDGSRSVSVQIGSAGGPEIPEGMEREAAERAIRLADPLIRCEIPGWDEPPGSEGRIRILHGEAPWLDAVDHAEDWLLERTIDLEELAEMSWETEQEETPEP